MPSGATGGFIETQSVEDKEYRGACNAVAVTMLPSINEDDGAKMKELFFSIVCLGFCASALGQNADSEVVVRQTIRAFYSAYHDGFVGDNDFAAEDWNHINPAGGWTRGRENVLKEIREVHSTFLKGVTDTVEGISIAFASRDVAVATVTSRSSKFVTPDGVEHDRERNIRTFIVVNRGNRWLVMHDQNTVIRR